MMARRPWSFGSGLDERRYLDDPQSFDDLAQELADALAIAKPSNTRFQVEPKGGRYRGDDPLLKRLQCRRASWHVAMDPRLLDKFFNGRMGIRAQYYASPYQGLSMNGQLLAKLSGHLLGLAEEIDGDVELRLLRESLSAPSAKVWIAEKNLAGKKILRASDLRLVEDEIQNDWLDLAREVKNGSFGVEFFQLYCAAITGVRAPMPDQLEVKGAWITSPERCEYVTPDKRDRDCQLFMFGFT